jgi:hypothetical protein
MHRTFSLFLILITALLWSAALVGAVPQEDKPLVIYYSRTGTSAVMAHRLSELLGCPREEVRSKKNRFYLGAFTCVNDQLFDRDDEFESSGIEVRRYNPLIIVAPIWLHKIASPMRTYLKQQNLHGRRIYVIAANQGNYTDEKDGQELRAWLEARGAQVVAVRGIMTKGAAWEHLRREMDVLYKKEFVTEQR